MSICEQKRINNL